MFKNKSSFSFINSLPLTLNVCLGCGKSEKACEGCNKEDTIVGIRTPRVKKQNFKPGEAQKTLTDIKEMVKETNIGPIFPVNTGLG